MRNLELSLQKLSFRGVLKNSCSGLVENNAKQCNLEKCKFTKNELLYRYLSWHNLKLHLLFMRPPVNGSVESNIWHISDIYFKQICFKILCQPGKLKRKLIHYSFFLNSENQQIFYNSIFYNSITQFPPRN